MAPLAGPRFEPTPPKAAAVVKPVVVFGSTCASAGYSASSADAMALVNARRSEEIELRAIPRDCPTFDEATAWVRTVSSEHGTPMTAGGVSTAPKQAASEPATKCFTHLYVDWDSLEVKVA